MIFYDFPNQKAWVAEDDNKIVGCISVDLTYYFHRLGKFLRIIVVDKDHRRKKNR